MTAAISGVWAAALTPLDEELEVDAARLADHIDVLLASGCDGVVVFGTTGEASSFSVSERMATLDRLLSAGVDPARVVVGTGTPALSDTVALTAHATACVTAGVLVVPPFFYKQPSPVGIWDAYRELIERVDDDRLDLYLYHIPQVSAVSIELDLVHSLRRWHPETVVGIKDSSGRIESLQGFAGVDDDFAVLPGTERLLAEGGRLGARGVITATANVNPAGIARCQAAVAAGEPVDDAEMLAVRSVFERHETIGALKAWLAVRYDDPGWARVRPPLVPIVGDAAAAVMADSAAAGLDVT